MKKVEIYTDGACSNNPGIGGWAGILIFNGKQKEISGGETLTTNNKMELQAVISSLEALKEPCEVDLHSDSAYVVNAFTNDWITSWQLNSWRTQEKKAVKNADLWKKLVALTHTHKVKFIKVKGHSDDKLNNRCDELAKNEILKISATLNKDVTAEQIDQNKTASENENE